MSLLGLDIGSTSIKGVVFDTAGAILAHSSQKYRTVFHENTAEADAEEMWQAAARAIREAAAQVTDIQALCVSSHGETFVPVDKDFLPVYRAIMNSDNRAAEQTGRWESGARKLYDLTGVPLHPMFAVNKIRWALEHLPGVIAKTRWFLSPGDYILARMGMEPVTDYSLGGRTMMLDIHARDWSDEILCEAGIRRDMLPRCVPSGTLAGRLSPKTAEALGLREGTAVAVGGHDQPLSALGCGAIGEGQVTDSAGTYECLAAVSHKPKNNDAAYKYALNSYCHAVKDTYITLAFFPAGFATNWFIDNFCCEDRQKAAEQGKNVYEYLSEQVQKSPTGVCVLPHLIGSNNPHWDPRARGAIYGIGPDTTRHTLFQAVFEGLSMELALNTSVLEEICGRFDAVRISGGNAQLPFSLQMRADVTGKRFDAMDTTETVCKGAAMLAGIACGVYRDYEDAVQKAVHTAESYTPDMEAHRRYARQQAMYSEMYSSLENVRRLS